MLFHNYLQDLQPVTTLTTVTNFVVSVVGNCIGPIFTTPLITSRKMSYFVRFFATLSQRRMPVVRYFGLWEKNVTKKGILL
jgi:hypothetical protein